MNWIFLIATYTLMAVVLLWLKRKLCPKHYFYYVIQLTWWDKGTKHITFVTCADYESHDHWDEVESDDVYKIHVHRNNEKEELQVDVFRSDGMWQVPKGEVFWHVNERVV
jgi:hypothetical protein